MFIGEYEHSLDDKGRIILPIKFRYSLGEKFYITKGLHGCLFIFPEPEWTKFNQSLSEQPVVNLDATRLQRFFSASAFEVTTDSQNRLAIPAVLRKYAKIEDQAVVVGAANRVEVWNPELWEAVNSDISPEEIAASAQALGLSGSNGAPVV